MYHIKSAKGRNTENSNQIAAREGKFDFKNLKFVEIPILALNLLAYCRLCTDNFSILLNVDRDYQYANARA